MNFELKFLKFLKSAKSVLDSLCCTQGSFVIGVDVRPIKAIQGVISVVEDITTAKCRATIAKHMPINGVKTFNVV